MEREVQKQIERKDKLAVLTPGGAAERAIEVSTASLIEPMARALKCPRCDGPVRLEEHVVEGALRVANVRCSTCGSARPLYFRITAVH